MPFDNDQDDAKRDLLLELIHESLQVQSHRDLFCWLRGKLQVFLPHEIMIAAWGDFSLGLVYFDIASSLPGLNTQGVSPSNLSPLLKRLFGYWCNHSQAPFTLNSEDGLFNDEKLALDPTNDHFKNMKSAVVHGIKDRRGHHDCLYVLLNSTSATKSSEKMLEVLMPYMDYALRQTDPVSEQLPTTEAVSKYHPEEVLESSLSSREEEIMEWVCQGKTNMEIGMILDISTFTVKNHLQRIFKKLDVLNRAQAVSRYRQAIKLP